LLGVLPHVFVTPLTVAKADHRLHFGQDGVEHAGREQGVEPLVGVLTHHHAVEQHADVLGLQQAYVGRFDKHDGPIGNAPLGAGDGALQRVNGAVTIGRSERCFGRSRHG
jgi:hypothetical protein